MRLRVRQDDRVFEVEVPAGSRVEVVGSGNKTLVIPGPTPEDTVTAVPRRDLLRLAQAGLYGLVLRGEVRPPQPS
jgi:hypothetical protein